MKLYKVTLHIAVSDELEHVAGSGFTVDDLESELLEKSMRWFQNASGVKDLNGYVAVDSDFNEKEV